MKTTVFLLLILWIGFGKLDAQNLSSEERYKQYGRLIRVKLRNTAFPHPDRKEGKTYLEKNYPADKHYQDSTVLIFVPHYFEPSYRIDLIVHFHGWFTNVDSVLVQFKLIEQLVESRKNAILVIPEGAKDAPESLGGKLENEGVFEALMDEVMEVLANENIRNRFSKIGDIVLSGHSGAYRTIGYILLRGASKRPSPVREVYLFDGLYGELEKYGVWIVLNGSRIRFLNIYTDHTSSWSKNFIEDMKSWDVKGAVIRDSVLTLGDLEKYNVISIPSSLDHYDVMHVNRYFYKFLLTSSRLKTMK